MSTSVSVLSQWAVMCLYFCYMIIVVVEETVHKFFFYFLISLEKFMCYILSENTEKWLQFSVCL